MSKLECEHTWSTISPYRILVCVTFEEPDYYPPSGSLPVDFCLKCGVIRLKDGIGSETDNYQEARIAPKKEKE